VTRKKTAKSYAALRHEIRCIVSQKNNAAFRLEGGISCAGLSRFVCIILERIRPKAERTVAACADNALIPCLVSSTPGQRSLPLSPSAAPFWRGRLRKQYVRMPAKTNDPCLLRCGFAPVTKRA
jgi:hypothetical protein